MSEYGYRIYEAIAEATNSEVILFFIIVAVVLAVVVAPLYVAVLRDRKAARTHDAQRDKSMQDNERENRQQIIAVVEKNSEAITRLTITLDKNGASQVEALKRIHDRLDSQDAILRTQSNDISQINTKFDNSTRNQTEMVSKINKILVLTSGGALPPDDKGAAE